MYTKRPMVHPPMRRRNRMPRLMQLLEKMNKKGNNAIKERGNGIMNDQSQNPKVNLSSTPSL
jgi:hypothetical protein